MKDINYPSNSQIVEADVVSSRADNILDEDLPKSGNRLHRTWNSAKRTGQTALVMAEIAPITNEGSRLAIFGLTEGMTHNSLASGAALGLSTFVIEGLGGIAAANLFETTRSKKIFEAINEKGSKIGVPMEKKLSVPAKVWWTLMGGTVVGMALEQREDPSRTKEQNHKYSMFTSAWQGGVLTVAGAIGAEGINATLEDPKKGILVGGAIAGVAGAGNWIRKKRKAKPC